jgi:hypothetical protein
VTKVRATWLASLFVLAPACAAPTVRPDDMSAARHRQEASRERLAAEADYQRFRPTARAGLSGPLAGSIDTPGLHPLELFPFNPTERALGDAERHLRHAREHEAAAAELERFEADACADFGPHTRAACPVLGPAVRVEDRADGVRFHFGDEGTAQAMAALMRCHLAFARARGFERAGDCPLYQRGVAIAVAGGDAVDVRSSDPEVVRNIQIDSHQTGRWR